MPRLMKGCPNCYANVHVRKSSCECGHYFGEVGGKLGYDSARKSERIAGRNRRASATIEETSYRREQSRVQMTKKRKLESSDESASRKEQNRANMAKKRALESSDESMYRKEQNQANVAKKRQLKSQTECLSTKEQNQKRMAKKRTLLKTLLLVFCQKSKWVQTLYAHVVTV